MQSIKSYTDREQSKKLAEILPLESADMCWTKYIDNGDTTSLHATVNYGIVTIDYPCWSLAALLDVLPRVDIEKEICSDDTYDYRVKAYIGDGYIGEWYDNSIDACYEMILKLHEHKML